MSIYWCTDGAMGYELRYRLWCFCMLRYERGTRPQWFWDWASNVTFISAYRATRDDIDQEIEF